jgi:hypothetical protein
MSETHLWQQLGGKQTSAGGGADSEARRAGHLDAGAQLRFGVTPHPCRGSSRLGALGLSLGMSAWKRRCLLAKVQA